jgi:versiconal hemiacetal acetate esterase
MEGGQYVSTSSRTFDIDGHQLSGSRHLQRVADDIADYRKLKQEREAWGRSHLDKPAFALLKDGVLVENTTIELPEVPGHRFPVRLYKPNRSYDGKLPVMIYFHGGWWCGGTADAEDLGCRAIIARGNDIVIVSFGYRLIPEVDWRTVFSDAENAVKWTAAHAEDVGGDINQGFIVGGADAGAHLAAISAIRVRDRHPEIRLTGQNLIVPTTIVWPDPQIPDDWNKRLSSQTEQADAPLVNNVLYQKFVKALGVPDSERRKGENFPVWADLHGLPPAYLPMDECDPIRDQGFLYNELLSEAGVKTRTDYYRGMPNMFVQFPDLPRTLVAGGHLAAGIEWLLQERK